MTQSIIRQTSTDMNASGTISGYYKISKEVFDDNLGTLAFLGADIDSCKAFEKFYADYTGNESVLEDGDIFVPVEERTHLFDKLGTFQKINASVYRIKRNDTLSAIARRFKIENGVDHLLSLNTHNSAVASRNLIRENGYIFIDNPEEAGEGSYLAPVLESSEAPAEANGDLSIGPTLDYQLLPGYSEGSLGIPATPSSGGQQPTMASAAGTALVGGGLATYAPPSWQSPYSTQNPLIGYLATYGQVFGTYEGKQATMPNGNVLDMTKLRLGMGVGSIAYQWPDAPTLKERIAGSNLDLRVGMRPASVGLRVPLNSPASSHPYLRGAAMTGERVVVPLGSSRTTLNVSFKLPDPSRTVLSVGSAVEKQITWDDFTKLLALAEKESIEEATLKLSQLTGFGIDQSRIFIRIIAADKLFFSQSQMSEVVTLLKQRGTESAITFMTDKLGIPESRARSACRFAMASGAFAIGIAAEIAVYLLIGLIIDEAAEYLEFDPNFSGRQPVQLASAIMIAKGAPRAWDWYRGRPVSGGYWGSVGSTMGWTAVGVGYNHLIGTGIDYAADEFGFDPDFSGRGVVQFTGTASGIMATRAGMSYAGTAISNALYTPPTAAELSFTMTEAMGTTTTATTIATADAGTASAAARTTTARYSATELVAAMRMGGVSGIFARAKGPAIAAVVMIVGGYLLDEATKSEKQKEQEAILAEEKASGKIARQRETDFFSTLSEAEMRKYTDLKSIIVFLVKEHIRDNSSNGMTRIANILAKPEYGDLVKNAPQFFIDALDEYIDEYISSINPKPWQSGDNPNYGQIEAWENEVNTILAPAMELRAYLMNISPASLNTASEPGHLEGIEDEKITCDDENVLAEKSSAPADISAQNEFYTSEEEVSYTDEYAYEDYEYETGGYCLDETPVENPPESKPINTPEEPATATPQVEQPSKPAVKTNFDSTQATKEKGSLPIYSLKEHDRG